jgi:hypothetical protein
MEFSVGCHARWSNFVEKSNEFPLASTPEFSPPVEFISALWLEEQKNWGNHVNDEERLSPLRTPRVKEVSVRVGLVGLAI